MLELLIAILIALGCTVRTGATEEEIKAENYAAYEQAQSIMESGNYEKTTDGGGVVIVTVVGD